MTKKFDKSNALHFKLLHRSVKDKSGAGEGVREFVPLNELAHDNMASVVGHHVAADDAPNSDIGGYLDGNMPADSIPQSSLSEVFEAGEAAKFGIFYDDRAYDYTKHLKKIGEAPDAVFIPAPDNLEGDERLDGSYPEDQYSDDYDKYDTLQLGEMDPAIQEVLEALNDDAYETDEFDDELVVKLDREDTAVLAPVPSFKKNNKSIAPKPIPEDSEENTDDFADDFSYNGTAITGRTAFSSKLVQERWDLESLKGKSYAASLAITHIDSKFEHLLREYEEDEEDILSDISDYHDSEVDENMAEESENEHKLLQEALDEFLAEERNYIRPSVSERRTGAAAFLDEIRREMGPISDAVLNRILSDSDAVTETEEESESEEEMFDCQSILTTATNTENLPNVIKEVKRLSMNKKGSTAEDEIEQPMIRLSRRGLPILPRLKPTTTGCVLKEDIEGDEDSPKVNRGVARKREETTEEKRARKSALKQERKTNRATKKDLKVRFALGEA